MHLTDKTYVKKRSEIAPLFYIQYLKWQYHEQMI